MHDLPVYLNIEDIYFTDISRLDLTRNFNDLIQRDIPTEPICDEENKCMTPKAEAIFSEWYDKYIDPDVGKMTKETAVLFIFDSSTEMSDNQDDRIESIFENNAKKDPTKNT